jgi:hypothetical protein
MSLDENKCDIALIMLKRQIKAILDNTGMIDRRRFKAALQKKNKTAFSFIYHKKKSITHEQNNKIAQLVKSYVQNEIFFELLVSDEPCMKKRIEHLIVKYEMETSSYDSIYGWIRFKRNNVKAA